MINGPPSATRRKTVDEQLPRLCDVHCEEIDAERLTIDLFVIMQQKAGTCTTDATEAQVDEALSYLVRAASFSEPRDEWRVVARDSGE